ncbi:MAG: hypothetical protein HY052_00750 [Proteobacteria bacterium]|nr:hypothetical protein [Pseudomonadota bacterium]
MTESNLDTTTVEKKIKGIVDYVRDCQARVTRGEIMDLQGLDKNVMKVCDAVAKLPKNDGRALEKQMSHLIESLETLARTMKQQQDAFNTPGVR